MPHNGDADADVNGAQLFVRYAYPPNSHGYCGPPDSAALLQYGAAGVTDRGLVELAQGFEGAWPYLQLIAESTDIRDPLDRRVVEAYWVGGPLLDSVGLTNIANSMEQRFRRTTGRHFSDLVDGVLAGGVPHHSFNVFEVYPWRGRLRDDHKSTIALHMLDRCRIRWGQILAVSGDEAVVRFRPMSWDGVALSLGEPDVETARIALDGTGFRADFSPGDIVSLHWDWVCDRLSQAQLHQLQRYTARHIDIANGKLAEVGAPLTVE